MKSFKSQKVRKSVHRGLGKKEKLGPREDFQNVHKVRDLENLFSESFPAKYQAAAGRDGYVTYERVELTALAVKAVKLWLMDWEHHFRMNDEPDSQDIVFTMLEHLNDKGEQSD